MRRHSAVLIYKPILCITLYNTSWRLSWPTQLLDINEQSPTLLLCIATEKGLLLLCELYGQLPTRAKTIGGLAWPYTMYMASWLCNHPNLVPPTVSNKTRREKLCNCSKMMIYIQERNVGFASQSFFPQLGRVLDFALLAQ